MNKSKFLEKARSIHGYKYEYINLPNKLIYSDYIDIKVGDIVYNQRVVKHLSGKCPEKNTPIKTTNEFISQSKEIWGDRFDYSITEYIGANKKIKLIEKSTGNIIEQIPSLHLNGHTCKKMKQDEFINLSELVSDYIYLYDKCEYVNKTTKVTIICAIHGEFKISPFNHLNGGKICNKCLETKFVMEISKFLTKQKINFSRQHKFDDCKNNQSLPFDFYITSMRTCIEFQNEYHFNTSSKYYEILKTNDKIKNDYCEDNYINLIRIKHDEFDNIHHILWENLKFHINRLK